LVDKCYLPAKNAVFSGEREASHAQGLEALEEQIDDCLTVAKHMDRDALDDVIRLLRNARNAVVWKLGA
jgi:DNA-binding MurR/RpiR family transcriptional regulator